ncbi:MAG: 1-deoxy-D-xylulose-5-phosphate synthase [Clostridia bacterium]|nr:1-deoxy-D-xylulose-5-phosphate synthase [Clostridia bacterium]
MDFNAINSKNIKSLSEDELVLYSEFLRSRIIDVTLKNGGHLASNLGAVELTVALHYVLDMPSDKVVWDVGHQTYAHKLITDRANLMQNLRHDGGASGFPSSIESEYDPFITGHSGNSLSLALGLARARDMLNKNQRVVAVVGDGAFTSGEIYEALNDLGDRPSKLVIILNDNKMSISHNVGAMSKYFNKLRVNKKFVDAKRTFKADLSTLPFIGRSLVKIVTKTKDKIKESFVGNKFFERFGLKYYGPYDGHNVSEIISATRLALESDKPAIIHLLTKKGKGYQPAEQQPSAYHGISPSSKSEQKSMSKVCGNTLIEIAKSNEIAVVTAAMADGLCFDEFARRYPDRFFDVAIAEQHAVSYCAGLAKMGIKAYFGVYSTFLQRGFDQVLHDVCLNDLPVTFLIDRAGAVGADGVTHQGIFDLSYLSLIPNLAIASPSCGSELAELIKFSLTYNHPLAIRYCKSYKEDTLCDKIELGKWQVVKRHNSSVTVLAVGATNDVAKHISGATVVNARFVKPLDTALLDGISGTIITLEDNVLHGGFGSAVRDYVNGKNKVISLGHKNEFSDERSRQNMLEKSGICTQRIQKIVDSELLLLENEKNI